MLAHILVVKNLITNHLISKHIFVYILVKNHFHVHGLIVIKRSLDRTSSVDIDEHIPAKRNMSVRFVKKRL